MAQERKLSLKIPEHLASGVYANQLVVRHTREEFVLDFINRFPPQVVVVARVILSPGHMGRMIRALEDNLGRFESARGAVELGGQPQAQPAPQVQGDAPAGAGAPAGAAATGAPTGSGGASANPAQPGRDVVNVPERLAAGVYANQLVVSHSGEEFLLDFANVFPPDSVVTSRVFVSPRLFKRMITALKDNLSRYETAMRSPVQATLPPSTDSFLN